VTNAEFHLQIYLCARPAVLSHPWEQTLSLMSFIASNLEHFHENSTVYRVTTQSIMIDQLPTFHA